MRLLVPFPTAILVTPGTRGPYIHVPRSYTHGIHCKHITYNASELHTSGLWSQPKYAFPQGDVLN